MEMTLAQAAKIFPCTKQNLYLAIRMSKLQANKIDGKWTITEEQIQTYKQNRWNRDFSKVGGIPLFDKSTGMHSVNEAAKILGCNPQHVYHALRSHKIQGSRRRKSWVIHIDDIMNYIGRMRLGKKPNRGKSS